MTGVQTCALPICQEFIICTRNIRNIFVAWCARVPLIHVYPKDPHSYLKKSTNQVSNKLFDSSVRDFYCSIKRYVIKKTSLFQQLTSQLRNEWLTIDESCYFSIEY